MAQDTPVPPKWPIKSFIFLTNWKTVTNMPESRRWPGVAAPHKKIYVTGGFDRENQAMKRVDCYDPDTNTWSCL